MRLDRDPPRVVENHQEEGQCGEQVGRSDLLAERGASGGRLEVGRSVVVISATVKVTNRMEGSMSAPKVMARLLPSWA